MLKNDGKWWENGSKPCKIVGKWPETLEKTLGNHGKSMVLGPFSGEAQEKVSLNEALELGAVPCRRRGCKKRHEHRICGVLGLGFCPSERVFRRFSMVFGEFSMVFMGFSMIFDRFRSIFVGFSKDFDGFSWFLMVFDGFESLQVRCSARSGRTRSSRSCWSATRTTRASRPSLMAVKAHLEAIRHLVFKGETVENSLSFI